MTPPNSSHWGPIPELAAALDRASSRTFAACFSEGGPWAAFADSRIRLRAAPSSDVPAERNSQGWLKRFLDRWRSLIAPRAHRVIARSALPLPSLGKVIGDTHVWLGARNLDAVLPCFASMSDPVPGPFGSVTDHGIFWATMAWLAEADPSRFDSLLGPEAKEKNPFLLKWHPANLADRLVLHVSIERLVLSLFAAEKTPVAHTRPAGGLRRPKFLNAAVTLVARSPRVWTRVCRLAAFSPITLIVYGDLFATAGDTATARQAVTLDAKSDVQGWHAFWLTLLARSMTGVMLSPPGAEEALAEANLHREAVREKEPPLVTRLPWWRRWLEDPAARHQTWKRECQVAERSHQTLVDLRRAQCVDRLRLLSDLCRLDLKDLGAAEANGSLPHANHARLATGYFSVRTRDMFMRAFVARQTPLIVKAWPKVSAGLTGPVVRDRLVKGNGADAELPEMVRAFFCQLSQLKFKGARSLLSGVWTADDYKAFFDVEMLAAAAHSRPTLFDGRVGGVSLVALLATAARVDPGSMADACRQFISSVPWPLPAPDHRDRSPAQYFADWGHSLLSAPTADHEATVTEQVAA